MSNQRKEYVYLDETTGEWIKSPVSRDRLDMLFTEGRINSHTYVINVRTARQPEHQMGAPNYILYSQLSSNDIMFDPGPEAFLVLRAGSQTTIFSGPNNSGKTFFLKHLYSFIGHNGYLVACNRFSHIDVLNSRERQESEHIHRYNNFIQTFESAHMNTENNDLSLDQILTGLNDRQRAKLFSTAGDLLGNKFEMVRTDPGNSFSPFFVSMDGENLRYGSSGTRLLISLLGILLDERFSTILMDEPEIGLSPRIQSRLAHFLYDAAQRADFCPHIEHLYVATHSHIFLDRNNYSNNFVVTKEGTQISARPIESISHFHQLQFNMLGNELESLFLPSAIVIVEGESDVIFFNKVLELHLPDKRVAMVCAHGEGEILRKLNFFKEAFGDVASGIYRSRLFVVLDKQISTSLDRIANQGVLPVNIVTLSENGIEYYYPKKLLASTFRCDEDEVSNIRLELDTIEYNGIRHSKKELANLMAGELTIAHQLEQDVQIFIEKLKAACV